MSKYIGFSEEEKSKFISQIGTPVSSKVIFTSEAEDDAKNVTLFDAVNIDWKGYKIGDAELSYSGDVISYIQSSYSYVLNKITEISPNGQTWENTEIKRTVFLYKTTNKKESPELCDEPYSNVDFIDSSNTYNLGWNINKDNTESNIYIWQSSIIYVTYLNNNFKRWEGPMTTPILLTGENGINGNYLSTIFTRTNETPYKPKTGANYNTGLPTDINVYSDSEWTTAISGKTWSDSIPEGKEILWASTALIKDSAAVNTVWSVPRQMTDTETYDVEFAYKYVNDNGVETTPSIPDSTNSGTNPTGTKIWYDPTNDPSADWTQMYWRAERSCINGVWNNWVIIRIKGEQGTAGLKGDFTSTVFKRSDTKPSAPTGGEYNNPVPTGWSDGIPNGTGPVWSSYRTFTFNNDNNSEWSDPVLVADTPTYDVEFSPYSNNGNTGPRTTENIDTSDDWFDPTTDVTLPNDLTWEDMIWRAERNRATSQDPWSAWVITKIKGEDGTISMSLPYYEQRWKSFENIINVPGTWDSSNLPFTDNSYVGKDISNGWTLLPDYSNNGIVYMTSHKVQYDIRNNEENAIYVGEWTTPIRMTGIDGTAQNPIQPVLKYQWTASNTAAPSLDKNGNPGDAWKETPGIPTSENKYLWMIQGQRQNDVMITWDADADSSTEATYWSTPVCLSGADGQPGKDGDDLEFIYKVFEVIPSFADDNNNPAYWKSFNADDYLGPDGYQWTDHPSGVTFQYKYEYCAYRRKTGPSGNKTWGTFSSPFPWSIYGENGIDGDGVEYIYAVTETNEAPTVPTIAQNNYEDSQQSEWGVDDITWHDDPQELNSTTQKFQWVSSRKYRYPKSNENTLGGQSLDPNKKYWFDYSTPTLWNWYVNDGTNAAQIVMIYQRTNSGVSSPDVPSIDERTGVYVISTKEDGSQGGWAETPGNNEPNYTYLWMTSAHYTKRTSSSNSTTVQYTIEDSWQTPICLTGEPGHDGEDGGDIEFIYFRTADDNTVPTVPSKDNNFQQNDWPFVGTVGTNYFVIDGIKRLRNQDHDTWTDNPLGVSSTYDYEYAAIRRKPAGVNSLWGEFSPVFLWSKYGEDGVDGDGVEYIFFRPENQTEEYTFDEWNDNQNDDNDNINPQFWSVSQNDEHFINPWTDDPRGVDSFNRYEYVSVRHKRNNSWGRYSKPALWAKFAVDGLSENLTLESDNDSMAVSIDNDNITTAAVTSTARFYLYHNVNIVPLSYYNMSITDSNLNDANVGHAGSGENYYSYLKKDNVELAKLKVENSSYQLTITIPKDFNMTDISNELQIRTTATITDNSFDTSITNGTSRLFTNKVNGLHLSIDDIYQLQLNKSVLKIDANNTLEKISISLKSLTSNSLINNYLTAAENNLYVLYYDASLTKPIYTLIDEITGFSNFRCTNSYSSHGFKLYYYTNKSQISVNNIITNGVLLDTEVVSTVKDGVNGNPGVDSKSQEYIYMLTSDIDFFENSSLSNYYKPENWKTDVVVTDNYNKDDYPFINAHGTQQIGGISYVTYILNKQGNNKVYANYGHYDSTTNTYIGVWTDNPQGISETYPYEWVATRSYDTSSKQWESFSKPSPWANWGHTGEDGDGVEYIYYKNDNEIFDGPDPSNWTSDENFQSSEYINDEVNLTEYYGDYINQYLTFKALGSGEITLTIPANVDTSYVTSVSYKNNDESWQTTNNNSSDITITVPVAEGDIVEWKGIAKQYSFKSSVLNTNWNFNNNYTDNDEFLFSSHFKSTCEYEIYGNIMSLLYGDEFNDKYTFKPESNCIFMFMFGKWYDNDDNTDENSKLKDISNLILPATELVAGCYRYMFARNTNLNNIIKILPAKKPATRAYERMFTRCSSESASSISTKILLENNNNGIIGGMFGGYRGNIELNIEFWLNNIAANDYNGFDYFIQGVSNATIIQHGSYDLSTITRSDNSIPDNCKIIKSNGTLFWTDNPSGVNELYRYEWVSVRKYKEVTEDDTELLPNFDPGQKAWHPYSYPTLWAKYGERGPQGESGGSGLVIDFDNDSLQIAVNSNGLIKDNQEITTYVHLYSGEQDITSHISSVSIPDPRITGNNIYNPFNNKYITNNKYGYILNHNSSSYWYTFKVGNCDTNDNGEINSGEINPGTLSNNLQLPFTISYSGHDYIKRLNFIPIQYGRDGADAETFELMIPESSITYNPNDGTFTPSSITAQIKHINGSTTDIISYNTLYTTYNTNDITWKISYTVPIISEKEITPNPGSDLKPLSIDGTKGGSISPTDPSTPSESQRDLLSTTTYSDIATMNVNNTEYVEWKLWMNNKYVDMETTYIVHDGTKGDSGSNAFVIDWTNDQINLAVDADGYILPGQIKYTTLNLNSLNGVFGNNPSIYITWAESSSAEAPHKKFDKEINSTTSSNIKSSVVNYNVDISVSTSPKYIRFKHGYRNSNSVNNDYEKLAIIVGDEYEGSTRKAYIPQEGIEIAVTVYINSTYHTNSTSSWEFQGTKILRICGQHIAQDGEPGQNAVTYEIVPSVNAINYTTTGPTAISYVVNKYDGNTITTLTDSDFNVNPTNLCAAWYGNNSVSYAQTAVSGFINNSLNSGSIQLKLWSNNILIDSETIPILQNGTNGQKGEQGIQGFTGPVVRMRGEFNPSNYYSDGSINSDYVESDGIRYIDIVYYYGKYWKCNVHKEFDNSDSATDHAGIAKHTGYVNGTSFSVTNNTATSNYVPTDTKPSNWYNNTIWEEQKGKPYWVEATQFDFVATKLLYADQALINQLTTHELIATKSNGYPVAGITSGSKAQGQNGTLMSSLDPDNNSTITSQVYASENISAGVNDPSNVRIFAGEIYDTTQNSYSLTNAPFNVRQDGTAYMSKANIVGNVNIGGTVDISGNVNIHGNNVKIDGDLYANTLALSSNSFYYNELKMLPDFNEGERIEHHIMFYGADSSITYIVPQPNTYLLAITGSNSTLTNTQYGGDSLSVDDKALYTLYSGFGALPTNQSINGKFWLVTKTDLFVVPSANVPASISTRISATISVTSITRGIITVQVTRGAVPSVTKQYDGRNYTFSILANWSYGIQFDRPTYWRQKINGKYFKPGENNNPDVIVEDDLIIGETNHDYQYATGHGNEGQSVSVSTIDLRAAAVPQVSNDQNGGVMAYKINTQNGDYYDDNYNNSWYNISGSNAKSIIANHLVVTATCILTRS